MEFQIIFFHLYNWFTSFVYKAVPIWRQFYFTWKKTVLKEAVKKPKANPDLPSQLLVLSYTVKSL